MSAAVDPTESATLQCIEAAALKLLSPDERAALAERLWSSVEGRSEIDGPNTTLDDISAEMCSPRERGWNAFALADV